VQVGGVAQCALCIAVGVVRRRWRRRSRGQRACRCRRVLCCPLAACTISRRQRFGAVIVAETSTSRVTSSSTIVFVVIVVVDFSVVVARKQQRHTNSRFESLCISDASDTLERSRYDDDDNNNNNKSRECRSDIDIEKQFDDESGHETLVEINHRHSSLSGFTLAVLLLFCSPLRFDNIMLAADESSGDSDQQLLATSSPPSLTATVRHKLKSCCCIFTLKA
jgi:hypothetical protein